MFLITFTLWFVFCFFKREKELEARQGGMENMEGVGEGKNMIESYSTFIGLNKTEKTIKFFKIVTDNYNRKRGGMSSQQHSFMRSAASGPPLKHSLCTHSYLWGAMKIFF